MTNDVISMLPLEQLEESPFNPRRVFSGLAELAANIKSEGRIHEPLLVRPRASNVLRPDEFDGYQIVFGHRRARAAELAGLERVPCMVRAMTDAEARSAQVAENLQREDVHPLEEAEAFRMMIDAGDASADDLAERFGKSRSYIYGRLKLLQACKEVRDACLAGEIGSEVALLLARLRTDKLQGKALSYIKGKGYDLTDGGAKSFRQIRELLAEHFTLELRSAMFDTADATLLPDAGVCTTCPKRSGNAPEYQDLTEGRRSFWRSDIKGNAELCTDPDCFAAKKAAHLKRAAGALQAKGKTVIDGAKARQAMSATGEVKGAYVALKQVRDALKKVGAKVATVTIQDPRSGKTVDAVRREDLQAAGVKVKAEVRGHRENYEAQQSRWAEERAAREEAMNRARTARLAVLDNILAAAAQTERSAFDLRLIASALFRGVEYRGKEHLAERMDCETAEDLAEAIDKMPLESLPVFMLHCVLVGECVDSYQLGRPAEVLDTAAAHYGVAAASATPSTAARAAKKARKAKGQRAAPDQAPDDSNQASLASETAEAQA